MDLSFFALVGYVDLFLFAPARYWFGTSVFVHFRFLYFLFKCGLHVHEIHLVDQLSHNHVSEMIEIIF